MADIEKSVSLVLGSGGARGLAHIGVIAELEARGYRIASIAGCSIGALIGGIYAAGKLAPVIDGPYPLEAAVAAIERFGSGAHLGKVIIIVSD